MSSYLVIAPRVVEGAILESNGIRVKFQEAQNGSLHLACRYDIEPAAAGAQEQMLEACRLKVRNADTTALAEGFKTLYDDCFRHEHPTTYRNALADVWKFLNRSGIVVGKRPV